MLVEIFDVGVAGQEPEQLVDDRFQVQLLGGRERKALGEVEAHLVPENRERAGAGAVALLHALGEDAFHQIEILAHRRGSRQRRLGSGRSNVTARPVKFAAGTDYLSSTFGQFWSPLPILPGISFSQSF